jgi:hypothetical protein
MSLGFLRLLESIVCPRLRNPYSKPFWNNREGAPSIISLMCQVGRPLCSCVGEYELTELLPIPFGLMLFW